MKSEYSISLITKSQCEAVLSEHHYLSNIQRGFKSGVNVGLFKKSKLCGVCIFTGFPVPELVKGLFGLSRDNQEGFYELSRLCLTPDVQESEHNITSWFLSRAVKYLRKNYKVRAILSYADSSYHSGIIYRACNFKYYGLTAKKKDFWIDQGGGSFKKHSRGKVKGLKGEWRDRSRKHRFLLCYDKSLNILWEEVAYGIEK